MFDKKRMAVLFRSRGLMIEDIKVRKIKQYFNKTKINNMPNTITETKASWVDKIDNANSDNDGFEKSSVIIDHRINQKTVRLPLLDLFL